ncbi:hypothetical protein [Oenococcus kitaharae]|uniref:DUF4209 domain-containing protein n=1 Tax=Oenococcus kitaharae DSM 17330 TaxID=1045004 RepID=G9WHP3_9LACO|nr:hypothetical protein [Oenococcus kitaharae]EHN58617.1 hypothetical protein OKIT_0501 [Oenococcus kitaharae DSM 17330]OEY84686.1 hypothetical protein NT95_00930 [Oenococcus kitaharae]OEY84970.1 hypothetical protein NT96_02500 [Oenococcus kitaharae]OEY85760.1 hypothetical protein NV75_02805 [Oenococcus kitaharae]
MDILNLLKQQGEIFTLVYYGESDWASGNDIKVLIKYEKTFTEYFGHYSLSEELSLKNYIDYLVIANILHLKAMVPLLKNSEDTNKINELIKMVEKIQFNNLQIVKFISGHYSEIFSLSTSNFLKKQVSEATMPLLIKFQRGISNDVFRYLAKNRFYIIIDHFQEFTEHLEKNGSLEKIFTVESIKKVFPLRQHEVLDILIYLHNKQDDQIKIFIKPLIDFVFNKLSAFPSQLHLREIGSYQSNIKDLSYFLDAIQDTRANQIRDKLKGANQLLDKYLQTEGQEITQEIPLEEGLGRLFTHPRWPDTLLKLSYERDEDGKLKNCLNQASKGKKELADLVSSNIDSDDYFSYSYQNWLQNTVDCMGALLIGSLYNGQFEETLAPMYLQSAKVINEKLNGEIPGFEQDTKMFIQMLVNIKNTNSLSCNQPDQILKKNACYAASAFLCSLTEKLLKYFCYHFEKNNKFINLDHKTLGDLLDAHQHIVQLALGKFQVKNLKFFFLRYEENNKKIGLNFRNRLAHWFAISDNDLDDKLVGDIFYLYTSVLNSVLIFLLSAGPENGSAN